MAWPQEKKRMYYGFMVHDLSRSHFTVLWYQNLVRSWPYKHFAVFLHRGQRFFIGLLLIMGLFGKPPTPLKTAPALAPLVKRLL